MKFVSALLFLVSSVSFAQEASRRPTAATPRRVIPTFQLTLRGEGLVIPPYSGASVTGGGGGSLRLRTAGDLNGFLWGSLDADGSIYVVANSDYQAQVSVNGNLFVLQIDDATYRIGGPNGDMIRGLAGLGFRSNLHESQDWGFQLGWTLGGAIQQWTRPGQAAQVFAGAYTSLRGILRIWRVRGEVFVAYVFGGANSGTLEDAINYVANPSSLPSDWAGRTRIHHGAIVSGALGVDAFIVGDVFALSPEARVQFADMIDGDELQVTFGVSGNILVEP